jgi:hypothetical protein
MTYIRIEGNELVIMKESIEIRLEPNEIKDDDVFAFKVWVSENFSSKVRDRRNRTI